MTDVSLFIALICSWLALVLVVLLSGLRDSRGVWNLGGKIMSVIDEAIARFTAFTQAVLADLKGAKEANDAQTGKLAELQAALDAATADDEVDKATIAVLKAEVDTLQESVAAKINSAVDALENPVAEVPADEEPVVEEPVVPVDDVPVVEDVVEDAVETTEQ